jgi:RNA polymerase sigma-70 factor, ECF subfamily
MVPESARWTDVDLMTGVGRGDVAAAGALYGRYATTLLGVALRVLRQREEAEDVVHDVFVVVRDRAVSYVAERGPVGAWLVTLARNLSIDRLRRRERHSLLDRCLAPVADGGPVRNAPDPESLAIGADERDRVLRALSRLPTHQRTMLELTYFVGLSHPQIAAHENVPLGTIKSRVFRALLALREALDAEPAGGSWSSPPGRTRKGV